jgi:ribosomal protein L35
VIWYESKKLDFKGNLEFNFFWILNSLTPGFKPKKSLLKRIKITAKGRLLRRFSMRDHFQAKDSGKKARLQRKILPLAKPDEKAVKNLLPI